MNFTISDILRAPHKLSIGFEKHSPKKRINAVSTDSRSVQSGDLFIALRGEKFDGHTYLKDIASQGAIGAVVSERWYRKNGKSAPKKLCLFVVKDTLQTYGDLATIYRKKYSIPVLLIAGSNGKTTTKDVTSYVFGASFNVLKTEANYNNHVGLPRMLFMLTPKHDIAILEIGTNHPGEIARLTEIAQPTHGIITNIGREHLEFFKNVAGVAKEERALFQYLKKHDGIAFINTDDGYLRQSAKSFGAEAVTFGTTIRAQYIARRNGFSGDGKLKLSIETPANTLALETNLIADYAPVVSASVTALAKSFGISNTKIKQRLEEYKPHSKRMEIVKIDSGVLVINDCYNANPESFDAALNTLSTLPTNGKKYVVAGDMFELGERSDYEHRDLGRRMAKYHFDGYYFIGDGMKLASKQVRKIPKKLNSKHFSSKEDIATALAKILKEGDIILLKGSRGMRMERVLEALTTTR